MTLQPAPGQPDFPMLRPLPADIIGAANAVHEEMWRCAELAAEATGKALVLDAMPDLTEQESYAIAYVAGLRPQPMLHVGASTEMVMPECRIGWDTENQRFVVEER